MFSGMARSSEPRLLLLDTHIWVWLMFATGDLSTTTRIAVDDAIGNGRARIATISFWEIAMLAARGKLRLDKPAGLWVQESLIGPSPAIESLTTDIAVEAGQLPGSFRSDPADLIIVATARVTGATLMTRDRRILAYAETGNVNAFAA
jgi:PIN domain nuclease of toxin-antitoxin system